MVLVTSHVPKYKNAQQFEIYTSNDIVLNFKNSIKNMRIVDLS
jgi:hypothetical protein